MKQTAGGCIFSVFLCLYLISPAFAAAPDSLTLREFSALVQGMSEPGGNFHSDNFVSNESSYLHAIPVLRRHHVTGGVYVGVGPEQNFTYIAEIKPDMAFIPDIRRQNMLQHLLYKALFTLAETPEAFLSLLLSKPRYDDFPFYERWFMDEPVWIRKARSPAIDELVAYFDRMESDKTRYERNWARIEPLIASWGIVSTEDMALIKAIYHTFFTRQMDILYDLPNTASGKPPFPYPHLRDLLLAETQDGERANFLAQDASYRFVREMHLKNLIIPLTGDFAGAHTLRRVAEYVRSHGEVVSVFYTSNVEHYLKNYIDYGETGPTPFRKYLNNVKQLPIDDKSVFIRSYPNDAYKDMISHPNRIGDYIFTTLVQSFTAFLVDQEKYDRETHDFRKEVIRGFTRYRRVVTVGILE